MFNGQQKLEVTLLSKEEVEGNSKVLQKVGRGCDTSDWTKYAAELQQMGPRSWVRRV